jgi:hypothetical protein
MSTPLIGLTAGGTGVGAGVGNLVGLGLALDEAVGVGSEEEEPLHTTASSGSEPIAAARAATTAICRGLESLLIALLMLIEERALGLEG